MSYYSFQDSDGNDYGSFEVYLSENDGLYYWAAGFPGCLWDGEPMGPFDTEDEAITDAKEGT